MKRQLFVRIRNPFVDILIVLPRFMLRFQKMSCTGSFVEMDFFFEYSLFVQRAAW